MEGFFLKRELGSESLGQRLPKGLIGPGAMSDDKGMKGGGQKIQNLGAMSFMDGPLAFMTGRHGRHFYQQNCSLVFGIL